VLSGKQRVGEEPLAGKSTLNRLELGGQVPSRYKKIHYREEAIDELLTKVFLEAHAEAPEQIVLDLDTTDLPLHGHQEGRFFHGYYDSYCYLPLYIFAGEHLLCARLRTADQDAAAGSKDEVERIVRQIRAVWPAVRITVRADSGFCREELMQCCEDSGAHYVFGFARNERLRQIIEPQMQAAARLHEQTGKPARVFTEFCYRTTTGSWCCSRRVVAKAEQLEGQPTARVLRGDGLCTGARAAAVGAERDGTGAGASDDDPASTTEDRGADSDHSAQGVVVDGLQLSLAVVVRAGLPEPAASSSAASMTQRGGRRRSVPRFGEKPPPAHANRFQSAFRVQDRPLVMPSRPNPPQNGPLPNQKPPHPRSV
jgi:hypothetical protein